MTKITIIFEGKTYSWVAGDPVEDLEQFLLKLQRYIATLKLGNVPQQLAD